MFCVLVFVHFIFQVHAEWIVDNDICKTPDQKTGSCLPIHSCKPMLDALEKIPQPLSPQLQTYLKSYTCGYLGKTVKICCPPTPIFLNNEEDESSQESELPTNTLLLNYPEDESYELEPEFPDVSRHRNIRLLPKDCGHFDTDSKIVYGNTSDLNEFPWMALLFYRSRNGPQSKCGGTIINSKYILTAAHCLAVRKDIPLIKVRVGEYDLRTPIDCQVQLDGKICAPPYQDLKVEKIIIHPLYNPRDFSNDIGLIRVSRINLSLANSKPICLPLGESRNYDFTNKNAIVTGWGVTETGRSSPVLLKVYLPVIPLELCKHLYQTQGITTLDSRQLCAGGVNRDSCGGDSGGPLQVNAQLFRDTRYIQQGIVSLGPKNCGNSKIPGVYTRVAAFMDWLLDNLES